MLWGAIMGGLAVAFGAFGAHALKAMLTQAGRVDTFELAVRYQFYHALALLITGLLMSHLTTRLLRYSAVFFLAGEPLFRGAAIAEQFLENDLRIDFGRQRLVGR